MNSLEEKPKTYPNSQVETEDAFDYQELSCGCDCIMNCVHSIDYEEIERMYWKGVSFYSPFYGADTAGTLFDVNLNQWNVSKLDSLLSRKITSMVPGVNTSYLYVGMWRATFAWHTEDMELYSINYIHFGEPKAWYVIPPESRGLFEDCVNGLYPTERLQCKEFMRHKRCLISPKLLQAHGIPYHKVIHYSGEFMITFPGAYHAGFNLGYNIAESTNFAIEPWIAHGKKAKTCECRGDSVRIDMSIFEERSDPPKDEPENENTIPSPNHIIVDDAPRRMARVGKPKESMTSPSPKGFFYRPQAGKCDACFLDLGNEFVRCQTCQLSLHIPCIADPPINYPIDTYTCQTCRSNPSGRCVLCPVQSGYLIQLRDEITGHLGSTWAHKACIIWTPGGKIHRLDGLDVGDISSIIPSRFVLKCTGCHQSKTGSCIQCVSGKCPVAYHVTCAFLLGICMMTSTEDNGFLGRIYCKRHDPRKQEIKLEKYRSFAEPMKPGDMVWIVRGNVYIECQILENHQEDSMMDVQELETGLIRSIPYRKLCSPDRIQSLKTKFDHIENNTIFDETIPSAARRRLTKLPSRYNRDSFI